MYKWNLKREDINKRAKKNYFFFNKIYKFTSIKKKERVLDFGSGYDFITYSKRKKN